MPDDKSKRGTPDRKLVSAKQPHEVDYLSNKTGPPKPLVKKIIVQEGPSRTKVEGYRSHRCV